MYTQVIKLVSLLRVPPAQPERTSRLPIPLPLTTNSGHCSKYNFYMIGIANGDAVCSP
jgi:hypothetical protein